MIMTTCSLGPAGAHQLGKLKEQPMFTLILVPRHPLHIALALFQPRLFRPVCPLLICPQLLLHLRPLRRLCDAPWNPASLLFRHLRGSSLAGNVPLLLPDRQSRLLTRGRIIRPFRSQTMHSITIPPRPKDLQTLLFSLNGQPSRQLEASPRRLQSPLMPRPRRAARPYRQRRSAWATLLLQDCSGLRRLSSGNVMIRQLLRRRRLSRPICFPKLL
jgi:hypothetical protein